MRSPLPLPPAKHDAVGSAPSLDAMQGWESTARRGGGRALAMVAGDEVSPNLPIHLPGRETFKQLVRYT